MNARAPVILVVEDQPQIARMIQRELAAHAEVIVAITAADARARIDENRDLTAIVCDLELGEGPSGVDVLRHLRRSHLHTARIVLSALVPDDLGALMVSGLVQRFVAKPPRPGEIWSAIQEVLATTSSPPRP